jgi:hypothetical protein
MASPRRWHQFDTNQTYAAVLWKSVPRIGEVYFNSLPGHRQSIASAIIARASKCGRLLCVRIRHSNDRTRAPTTVYSWPIAPTEMRHHKAALCTGRIFRLAAWGQLA